MWRILYLRDLCLNRKERIHAKKRQNRYLPELAFLYKDLFYSTIKGTGTEQNTIIGFLFNELHDSIAMIHKLIEIFVEHDILLSCFLCHNKDKIRII